MNTDALRRRQQSYQITRICISIDQIRRDLVHNRGHGLAAMVPRYVKRSLLHFN